MNVPWHQQAHHRKACSLRFRNISSSRHSTSAWPFTSRVFKERSLSHVVIACSQSPSSGHAPCTTQARSKRVHLTHISHTACERVQCTFTVAAYCTCERHGSRCALRRRARAPPTTHRCCCHMSMDQTNLNTSQSSALSCPSLHVLCRSRGWLIRSPAGCIGLLFGRPPPRTQGCNVKSNCTASEVCIAARLAAPKYTSRCGSNGANRLSIG